MPTPPEFGDGSRLIRRIEIDIEMESGAHQDVEFDAEHLKDFDSTVLGTQLITIEYDDFEYVENLGFYDIRYRGRVFHSVQLYACYNARPL